MERKKFCKKDRKAENQKEPDINNQKNNRKKIYIERKNKKWKKWNQKERKIERKEERTKESKKETIISVFPEKTFKKLYCT